MFQTLHHQLEFARISQFAFVFGVQFREMKGICRQISTKKEFTTHTDLTIQTEK